MFETALADGVLQVHRPGTRWLATGYDGGYRTADAAYNVTVPAGFDRTDLVAYAAGRRERAGFDPAGPTLLTAVQQSNARCARSGPVAVVATAGLTNPATLPMDPAGEATPPTEGPGTPGTVNLVVGTTRALDDGGLATLLATAVEAKTATLRSVAGVTGTTTDAVVVGCDPTGDTAPFAGSATAVGAATRACVREALRAGLAAVGSDGTEGAGGPDDRRDGVSTERTATVYRPTTGEDT
jgi:adenosylcobinamide hydrolase